MEELDTLAGECTAIEETLRGIPADAWERPALGEWNLHVLVAHIVRGVGRLKVYLDQGTDAAAPEHDRASYFRYDPAGYAAGAAERARQEAAALPPEKIAAAFATTWRSAVDRAAPLPPEHLMGSPFGPMRLREYVATRVLEAVVHHIDVRRALDLPPTPTAAAGKMTLDLLERMLGEPRPRNLGRVRFILTATGRLPSDDPRFPLLQ